MTWRKLRCVHLPLENLIKPKGAHVIEVLVTFADSLIGGWWQKDVLRNLVRAEWKQSARLYRKTEIGGTRRMRVRVAKNLFLEETYFKILEFKLDINRGSGMTTLKSHITTLKSPIFNTSLPSTASARFQVYQTSDPNNSSINLSMPLSQPRLT